VPLGSASLFSKAVGDLRVAGTRLQTVVLRFGETLDDVAKARGSTVRELKRINDVTDSSQLRGGMTILVPARAAPPAAPTGDDADDTILVAVPDRAFAYEGRERVFYRTRDGDTLADIAQVFDVAPEDIVEWNNIDPDAKLQRRLILQIFVREGFDRESVMLLDPDKLRIVTLGSEEFLELEAARRGKTRLFYAARAGDTLAKIAKRYGLSPGDLARINRLSAVSELSEGQRVVVYSPTPELPKEITSRASGRKPARKQALAVAEPRTGKGSSGKNPPASKGKPQSAKVNTPPTGRGKPAPAARTNGKKPTNGKR
jgi:membrane-bound lytic murein transglycosylase D